MSEAHRDLDRPGRCRLRQKTEAIGHHPSRPFDTESATVCPFTSDGSHSPPRRTKPGSTPSGGGRNPDPHPQVADQPRIDPLRWRTNPGSTPPQMADQPRIHTPFGWRTNPGSTPPSGGGPTPHPHPLRVAAQPRIHTPFGWRTTPGSTPPRVADQPRIHT